MYFIDSNRSLLRSFSLHICVFSLHRSYPNLEIPNRNSSNTLSACKFSWGGTYCADRLIAPNKAMSSRHDYFIMMLEKSQLMLAAGTSPVKEMACELTFNDYSYFNHRFKKLTGMSPPSFPADFCPQMTLPSNPRQPSCHESFYRSLPPRKRVGNSKLFIPIQIAFLQESHEGQQGPPVVKAVGIVHIIAFTGH